jgi:hypothetical protein
MSIAVGYWLLAVGYWLLAVGCWLLAVGCWLLAVWRWLWQSRRDGIIMEKRNKKEENPVPR